MRVAVGRVREIFRYPVKSMAGESIAVAQLDWQGIEGDRQYGFYRREDGSRFPWQTARELPQMLRYRPRFREPMLPKRSPVDVLTPDGRLVSLADPALLAELSDAAAYALGLMQLGRGAYDAMPVSVVTSFSHAALDRASGTTVDCRRFRSNIIIDAEVSEARWAGGRVTFGEREDSAELHLAEQIDRCALITIDPETASRDRGLMRVVAQDFGNRFGVYGATARPGTIQLDDLVYLRG